MATLAAMGYNEEDAMAALCSSEGNLGAPAKVCLPVVFSLFCGVRMFRAHAGLALEKLNGSSPVKPQDQSFTVSGCLSLKSGKIFTSWDQRHFRWDSGTRELRCYLDQAFVQREPKVGCAVWIIA